MCALEIADLYGKEGVNYAPLPDGATRAPDQEPAKVAAWLAEYARNRGLDWRVEWRAAEGEPFAFATLDPELDATRWYVIGETAEQARACISQAATYSRKPR